MSALCYILDVCHILDLAIAGSEVKGSVRERGESFRKGKEVKASVSVPQWRLRGASRTAAVEGGGN